jgi:SAM-dependent methyltransferase
MNPASSWIQRWSHLVPAGSRVLDLACGSGRHVHWFAARGCHMTAVDRDAAALATLAPVAELIVADLEAGPWPLAGRRFDAVVVTNYLWRERLPDVLALLADGGLLLYETFAAGHERLGRPARADFLLRPGELLQACSGLQVLAYEMGELADPPRVVQRIAAQRAAPGRSAPWPQALNEAGRADG